MAAVSEYYCLSKCLNSLTLRCCQLKDMLWRKKSCFQLSWHAIDCNMQFDFRYIKILFYNQWKMLSFSRYLKLVCNWTICSSADVYWALPMDQGLCWRSGPYLSLGQETLNNHTYNINHAEVVRQLPFSHHST